ncbi:MFS transporter [Pseudonocardia sp. MH-G8]|uniref:MFS transporter n=1 Tax=Pseudonocardia sp. MH-G8 TaxID=1854588 RepID=UPI000BA0E1EF|nr:MFS transporter [Pseudonocardia sp. MH-G8]OZM81937.1 MFS transporter [Pseudonocardia sp. MH-G8]
MGEPDEHRGVAGERPPTQEGTDGHPRRWLILVAVCVALLIIVVDNTVLSVALPAIADELGAGTAALQAVVDAYVVVFAGLLVVSGVAADRLGRRRTVLVGLAVFAMASTGAALAGSPAGLVVGRAVMGVGAALVMPATLAILVQVFPDDERPRAFAAWAGVAAVAMAAGPVLGGFLVEVWSWAGVFWINVPLAVFALAATAWLVPESSDPDAPRVDLVSAVLVTGGMSGLVLAVVVLGESGPADPLVALGLGAAAIGLCWFAVRQRRAPAPMVDLGLYRNRVFAGASAAAALLTLGTGSALFVLTQHLQLVLGLTAVQAGAGLAPLAVGVVAGSTLGGRAPARIGVRGCVVIGFALVAAGFCVLAALHRDDGFLPVALGLALLGTGTGFSSPAVTSAVLGAVPRHRAGMGSALNDTHQQLGIAVGVAALGGFLSSAYRNELHLVAPVAENGALAATLASAEQLDDAGLAEAAKGAFVTAQGTTMLVAAGCAGLGAVVAGIALRPGRTTTGSDGDDG